MPPPPLSTRRAALIVLDGVGIGSAHDAAAYGDLGSNTLANLARDVGGLRLPHFEQLGLGNLDNILGVRRRTPPRAAHATLQPASAGKDSTTGHWELCGLHLAVPFPTYPNGFPTDLVDQFARLTGRGVIGNVVGSGTAVLDQFGAEHQASGRWILYTSADSVFQVAAHEDVIPLEELERACRVAREMLVAPHNLSRVIARPFVGPPGAYRRTANRRDFSIPPPGMTLLDAMLSAGVPRTGVGKVDDLFAGRGIKSHHTTDNVEGLGRISAWLKGKDRGFLFANLVDFDQQFGHRNDRAGFQRALEQLDGSLPELLSYLREDDLLIFTADHGNDPTTPSTDHARERVPLLVAGPKVLPVDLGERSTFSDVGATLADYFGLSFRGAGRSFLGEVLS